MINISKHCMDMYLERIKGVDKKEIQSLKAVNSEIYKADLNKMFDNSKFIYQGRFNDTHKKTKFFVSDSICLVVSLLEDVIITLFPIDFGFNRTINKTILSELMSELEIKDKEYLEITSKVDEEINVLLSQRDELDDEISSLEMSLKALRENREGLDAYIKSYGAETKVKKQERDVCAKKICYSNIYRNAMEEYSSK